MADSAFAGLGGGQIVLRRQQIEIGLGHAQDGALFSGFELGIGGGNSGVGLTTLRIVFVVIEALAQADSIFMATVFVVRQCTLGFDDVSIDL